MFHILSFMKYAIRAKLHMHLQSDALSAVFHITPYYIKNGSTYFNFNSSIWFLIK